VQVFVQSSSRFELISKELCSQPECAQYFISLRSTSCLEYLKSLNFFFKSDLLQYAVGFGHLDTVKFLRNTS
jgi:hypothetical protein